MHGMGSWHPSFLVAQPMLLGALKKLSLQHSHDGLSPLLRHPGEKEWVIRMLVATPVGIKA